MPETPPTSRTVLDNGLTVVIRESRRVPVASFWAWYRVGARNEVPGITGISHWVEHMLFKGTPTWKVGEIFRSVNKYGGTLNGFTWLDYTAYYETLPSAEIGLSLDIESDRMCNALFDPEAFESERTVILSEREGNENQPTFFLREEVNAAAFKAHPYGQGVIGHTSDLRQMNRDDLFDHYRRYYVPNNAIIVVVGDVDPKTILSQIEQQFGAVSRGSDPPAVRTAEPEQQGERRVTVRRPAPAATVLVSWHSPEATHPDAPAMMALDTVLSGGKSIGFAGGGGMGRSSRLYRSLVASGLASSAGSSFALTIDPYLLSVSATLVESTEPARVEEVIVAEIQRLRQEPVPEDELSRAIKQLRVQFAYGQESVASQAYLLGSLEMVAPGILPEEFFERVFAVTPDDIQRVANRYLHPEQSTLGWLYPTDQSGESPARPSPAQAVYRPHFYSGGAPSGAGTTSSGPRLGLRERTLPSGMRLVGHHDSTSDATVIDIRLPAGSLLDGDLPGLASFAGRMLTRGTANRSFAELNEELDRLGAAISVGVSREHVDITGKCLKEDAARLAELMAEVITAPSFPEDEIDKVRAQTLNGLRQALNDTRSVADQTLRETLYPEGHPYRHRTLGTAASLLAIQQADLLRFTSRAYRPEQAIVATAGGLEVDAAWEIIEDAFSGWQAAGDPPAVEVPDIEAPPQRVRRDEYLPGKSQADIAIGLPSLRRSNPDHDALRVANLILGRLGLMGRLGASVRERQGMAYHASSSVSSGLAKGLWIAHAGVNPGNIDRAIESILEEVERMRRELVSQEELADAKSYLIGALPLGLESSDAIAATALDITFFDLGLDYVERLPDLIRALTAEELRSAAERYLLTDRVAIAVAQPTIDR